MPASGAVTNPAGVWGASSTQDGNGQYVELVTATTVTRGQVVALSTTEGQIVPCPAGVTQTERIVGIAVNSPVSGQPALVCVGGIVYGAVKDSSVAAAQFDRLGVSATTAGQLVAISAATAVTQAKDLAGIIAVAMASQTTGDTTVDVVVLRS